VGGVSGLVFLGGQYLFGKDAAIVFSMISQVLLTGALHEDGLADVCDGFGGGWTREKILIIMKDSRSGAFGVIGIALALLLKFTLLRNIPAAALPWALVAAHGISRWCSSLLIAFGHYAREDDSSKAKPVAKKTGPWPVAGAALTGLLPMLLWKSSWVLPVVVVLQAATAWLYHYFRKWIGGYTGDCLGAVQQVTEIIFYCTLLFLWKFTS
jgi:adenosylcobinamide-GDP ribazoletransferase